MRFQGLIGEKMQISNINKAFLDELAGLNGCSTFSMCYGCGSCSSVCPVEKVVPEFDPRKIVHMVGLGLGEKLVESDVIWACSQCQSCIPVCPQGVRCADVIKGLRQEASLKGLADSDRLFSLGMYARVDASKCVACLTCVRLCPFEVPVVTNEGAAYIDPEKCQACGVCVLECPAQAIVLPLSFESRALKAAGTGCPACKAGESPDARSLCNA